MRADDEQPRPGRPRDEEPVQLEPDIDDPGGKLPPGEAQDRRGPEPPDEDLLPAEGQPG